MGMTGGRKVRKDFLDEIVEERTAQNPEFPAMVDAALEARRLLRSLADRRRQLGLSQTAVAARMGTSQSALARLEGGDADPRISTVERFALAVGEELVHRPVPTGRADGTPRAGAPG
jgi:ribosome-binding protein aMBF1 (putative translation factor)